MPGGDQGAHQGEGQEGQVAQHVANGADGDLVVRGLRGTGEDAQRDARDEQGHRESSERPYKPSGGGSSYRLLDPVRLPLLSRRHFTALPSPNRYEVKQ